MAFVSEGSLGTAQNKTINTPLTFSPSRGVDAGQLIVISFACGSAHDPATPGGELNAKWACRDDAGNHYSTVVGFSGNGVDNGASAVIFICQLRVAITTSTVLTIDSQADTVLTPKSCSVWEYSLSPGQRWAVTDVGPWWDTSDFATDPDSMGFGGLASQEYLILHCLAAEGPDTDAYTWDSDYTQIDGEGTTGGADTSNIHVRGGFRIVTGTGDTIDVTSTTADRKWTQVVVALCEVATKSFPTKPIIDDFNRADEDPLDNGIWHLTDSCAGGTSGLDFLCRIISNRAAGGPDGSRGGQMLIETYEACVEAYVTFPVLTGSSDVGIVIHQDGDSQSATQAGFAAMWNVDDWPYSIHDNLQLGLAGNAGHVHDAKFRAWADRVSGNKLGVQRGRGNIAGTWVNHLWIDVGAGWEVIGSIFYADYSPQNVGRIGFWINNTTDRADDFGGGQIHCFPVKWLPQIIRRPPEGPFVHQ